MWLPVSSRALTLFFATLFTVVAAPLRASDNPDEVARALYSRYLDGALNEYKALWAEGVVAPLGDLSGVAQRRCMTLVGIRTETKDFDDEHAQVGVVALISSASRRNGRMRMELEHASISLRRVGDSWRVERWSRNGEDLARRATTAHTDEEARAIVRENSDSADEVFYLALRKESSKLIGQRKFDELQRLIAAMREYSAFTENDGALSTAYALESIRNRLLPTPDVSNALVNAEEAVILAERFGDPDTLSSALLNRVRAYQWRDGNSTASMPLLERVVAMRERLDDQGLATRAAILLAAAYNERGDYRASFPYIEIAKELANRTKDATSLYQIESILADLYISESDFELAIPHLRRAREFAEQTHFAAGSLSATELLARCYIRTGRAAESRLAAAEALKNVAPGLESIAAGIRTDVAREALERGDLAQADSAIQKAVSDGEVRPEDGVLAYAYETLARVRLAQKRFDDAIRAADRAIEMCNRQNSVVRFAPWLLAAQAHLSKGERDAAYTALRSALDYAEQERAGVIGTERQIELFFEPAAAAYVMLVDLLLEDHRYEEAFVIAEKAKARTLLDLLASERSRATGELSAQEVAEQKRLEDRLTEVTRRRTASTGSEEVQTARLDLESFRAVLDARYPRLRATRGTSHFESVASLAPILTERGAIVEYVVGEKSLHIFVIQRGTHTPRLSVRTQKISRVDLARLVNRLSKQCAARDAGYRTSARKLYRLLLQPALQAAGNPTLLSIVPDDALWRIPFEALIDGQGTFAIEKRAFHYAPSAAVLIAERSHRMRTLSAAVHTRPFLGFGNPRVRDSETTEFESARRPGRPLPLPESEHEVRSIARLFGPRRATVYLGAQALESRLKHDASDYRVIHFATHGVIDDQNPMYSRLLLAHTEGDGEDGALEAREMMKLNLTAELVVLSACDTAGGDVHAGEGLIGMTWALFAAGCPSVVASEWPVATKTTKTLMEAFYLHWLTGGREHPFAKAEALRAAQLELMRDARYRHPHYWAPFVLIGEPN